MNRFPCWVAVGALGLTVAVTAPARGQKDLGKLTTGDFQGVIRAAITAERKAPRSPQFKAADAVFVLNDASLGGIAYDGKGTLQWRCPLRIGVPKPEIEGATRRLQAFVSEAALTAGLVTGKQLDEGSFQAVVLPVAPGPDVLPPPEPTALIERLDEILRRVRRLEEGSARQADLEQEVGRLRQRVRELQGKQGGSGSTGGSGSGGTSGGGGGTGGRKAAPVYYYYYYPCWYGYGCGWYSWYYSIPVAYTYAVPVVAVADAGPQETAGQAATTVAPQQRQIVPTTRAAQSDSLVSASDEATRLARRALRKARPTAANADALFWRGYQLYWQKSYDEALDYFDAAVESPAQDARYWSYKALTEKALGLDRQAAESVRQATALRRLNLPQGNLLPSALERVQGPDRDFLNGTTAISRR